MSARISTSSARPSTSSARPSTSSATPVSMSFPTIRADDYAHSPVHYAVAIGDHATLSRLVLSLPRLDDPDQIRSEYDSLAQEQLADRISAAVDRRDVPGRETPLHLAVRRSDSAAAHTLASAGADVSLQNAAGWNPLQEALCRRSSDVALILLRSYHSCAWAKWRRRLPRLVAVLRRMRDFYMEISFHFESSIVPFVGKIAPSDTYKIWKRDGNLRADTSLAGFDGLKIQRVDQSFLFLGDGDCAHNIAPGSLLVLNRDDKNISDAFEHAGAPMSESDIAGFCAQTTVYRPGMDVTRAELVGRTNWRRQEKTETVGQWKARVYEVHNVVFSFRSKKLIIGGGGGGDADVAAGSEQVLPLELDEDEEGFLVAENPTFGTGGRRHSSFVREDAKYVAAGRRSVGILERPRMSAAAGAAVAVEASPVQTKEKEYVRSLRPSVWLTDQFPLNTEELLPLLDILANKVKAVRRMRELLTTKFPPGTFPVKVAIPVVPTVRVLITFTKFVELPPTEQFYTPLSSPRQFQERQGVKAEERPEASEDAAGWSTRRPPSLSSSSSSAWLKRSNSTKPATMQQHLLTDPFTIPAGYTWKSSKDDRTRKMKKSKSTRKSSK